MLSLAMSFKCAVLAWVAQGCNFWKYEQWQTFNKPFLWTSHCGKSSHTHQPTSYLSSHIGQWPLQPQSSPPQHDSMLPCLAVWHAILNRLFGSVYFILFQLRGHPPIPHLQPRWIQKDVVQGFHLPRLGLEMNQWMVAWLDPNKKHTTPRKRPCHQ